MNSENTMNDVTSFHQQGKPILCANGCGYFGTSSTMNLCSKCYRDFRLTEEQSESAKSAFEKCNGSVPLAPVTVVEEEEKPAELAGEVVAPAPEKPTNCCASCEKRISVMGFKCRCGRMFCRSHRLPEQHECTFDFKGSGKDSLAKANPVVKADKVERF